MSPVSVTATQSTAEVQEIADIASVEARDVAHGLDQAPAPPLGLVEVKIFPPCVPATQSAVVGQAIAVKVAPATLALAQSRAPPVGSVVVRTSPVRVTATQNVVEEHETLIAQPSPSATLVQAV